MEEPKKILVVEDEPNVAILLKHNLKRAGFDCEVAENGLLGLEKVKSFHPDLIISDIMMPELNGFEFRKKLIEEKTFGNIPFIFLTAKSADDDMMDGYALDIDDYVIKTSSPKIIIAKINNILRNKQRHRNEAEKEISTAAAAMRNTLSPERLPRFKDYKLNHIAKPYKGIPGGDFIDYFKIDDENIILVLGDVMGKRWGASYFAVAYAGYVRSAVRVAVNSNEDIKPSNILKKVNEAVFNDERISEVFIALSIVLLKGNSKIYYSGAGDLPILKKSGKDIVEYKSNGILLGFNKDYDYKDVEFELNDEEFILLFTDGVTDSRNTNGEALGIETLKTILKNVDEKEEPLQRIFKLISDFTAEHFEDDTSLICIQK